VKWAYSWAGALVASVALGACSSGTRPAQEGELTPHPDAGGGDDSGADGSAEASSGSQNSPDGGDAASSSEGGNGDDGGPAAPSVATAIAVGSAHACALTTGGQVICWGDNSHGQLGDGTTTQRTRPVYVSGLTGAKAIACGDNHTCAIDGSGGAWCWGDDTFGSVGDGSTATQRLVPTAVMGLSSGVVAIAAGGGSTCAAISDGSAVCWGANGAGQLGNGNDDDQRSPVALTGYLNGVGSGAAAMGPGGDHTCIVGKDTVIYCAGDDLNGALGNSGDLGTTSYVVSGVTGDGVAVQSSYGTSCAIIDDGTVNCWGFGGTGELGDGMKSTTNAPVVTSNLAGATSLAVGLRHACAVASTGVSCWGDNLAGDVGDGSGVEQDSPVAVPALAGKNVVALAAGGGTCALSMTGAVFCWGANGSGQIGDGTTTERDTPVPVADLP
jgi:alpha-tubulin suppressor-like RCC1 family protein